MAQSGMPRIPRAILPGQPLHLVQRGNNRGPCFHDDQDRQRYLQALRDVSKRVGCAIHAYVLMTNHVHLLLTAADARSPARLMQAVGRRYVRSFNDRHGRSGTLWEGRYRSTLVDSEPYFLACSRYIEMNPVRAGMVARPERYRWSSFRCNAHGEPNPLVTPHPLYIALAANASRRQDSYARLFSAPLSPVIVDAIRHATRTGTVLGSAPCDATLDPDFRRALLRSSHGGDRRSAAFASKRSETLPLSQRSTTLVP